MSFVDSRMDDMDAELRRDAVRVEAAVGSLTIADERIDMQKTQ